MAASVGRAARADATTIRMQVAAAIEGRCWRGVAVAVAVKVGNGPSVDYGEDRDRTGCSAAHRCARSDLSADPLYRGEGPIRVPELTCV